MDLWGGKSKSLEVPQRVRPNMGFLIARKGGNHLIVKRQGSDYDKSDIHHLLNVGAPR